MELTYEKYLIERAARGQIPLNASLELLPVCNMNCDMCYVRLSREEMERQGRLRRADEWLALADQMKEAGTLFVLLTGGEPLLYPGFREVYLGLRKMGMILTVNTNGTLLDEGWADFFAQHPPRRMNITLYGADEEAYEKLCHYPGGFEKTIRAIRLLRARNVDVKINGSLVRANEGNIKRIVDIAEKLDAAVNIDTYMYPAVRERHRPFDQQSRLLPEAAAQGRMSFLRAVLPKENYLAAAKEKVTIVSETGAGERTPGEMQCQAGRSSFTVNWQGYMRPCVMLTEPPLSVFSMDFMAAWRQLAEITAQIRLSSECSACRMRRICQNCAACAKLETGRCDGIPEYMCRYTEETLRLSEEAIEAEAGADDREGDGIYEI